MIAPAPRPSQEELSHFRLAGRRASGHARRMVNPVLALLALVMGVIAWIEYKKGNNYRFYLIAAVVLGVVAVIPLFLPRV